MSQRFPADALVVPFEQLRMADVESVGGKNASLGEMISQLPGGVRCPPASTTAHRVSLPSYHPTAHREAETAKAHRG